MYKHIVCFEGIASSSDGTNHLSKMVKNIFKDDKWVIVHTLKIDSTKNLKKKFEFILSNTVGSVFCVGKSLGAFRMFKILKKKHYSKVLNIVSIDPTNSFRLLFFPFKIRVPKRLRKLICNFYQTDPPRGCKIKGVDNRQVYYTDHMEITTDEEIQTAIYNMVYFGNFGYLT